MWIKKRTAGTQPGWAGLPAVLFLFALLAVATTEQVRAEDGGEDATSFRAALDIGGALQFEFLAAPGKAYTVEAQHADGSWVALFGPVYGNGTRIKEFVSPQESYADFRLDVESIADLGHAPDSVIGHAYSLNYGTKFSGIQFSSEDECSVEDANGIDRVISYSYQKTQPDIAQLMLDFGEAGGVEMIEMNFERGRIGEFSSLLSRPGRRDFKSSGTFRAGADVATVGQPVSLVGSRFVFRDNGTVSVITFSTDFSGSLSGQGGDTEVISYTYDVSSWPEALLTIQLTSAEETHAYQLSFNGRGSGIFVRRSFVDGIQTDTDRGKFSGKGSGDPDDDGKGEGQSQNECPAPKSLAGRTLQASVGGKVVTILLNGAGTGSILKRMPNGRVTLEPFTYSYSQESCTEGLLTIVSPTGSGDELQVFELDFTTESGGTCVRKRYEDGSLDDSDDGNFTLSEDDDDLVREDDEGGDDDA